MNHSKWALTVLLLLACNKIEESDQVLTADCTGLENFAPCAVVTSPDRSNDICVDEVCESPGCGTAACNAPGHRFAVPDTNQRICYDDGTAGPITCPTSGQEYFGQDAQYGWDTTHAANERFTLTASESGEPTVGDNITTLEWQGCTAGLSGDACTAGAAGGYNWAEALAYCDSLDWSGNTDWRLPDPYEIASIIDLGRYNPTIDPDAFPGTPGVAFWTSSSHAGNPVNAWYAGLYGGEVSFGDKSYDCHVRCVRGGTAAETGFSRNLAHADQPVVTDNVTSRIWQGCASGLSGDACTTGTEATHTWLEALAYCETLVWSEYDDWRLPTSMSSSPSPITHSWIRRSMLMPSR